MGIWLRELKPGLCNNLEGWGGEGGRREVQEGGDICKPMADSCWCMAETIKSNYPLIKNEIKLCLKKKKDSYRVPSSYWLLDLFQATLHQPLGE